MFCLGGFCLGGFWQGGVFVQGVFVWGFMSGGFCPGGFCPRTKESCLILSLEPLIQGVTYVTFSNNICRQHFFKLTCVIEFFMPSKLGFYFSNKKRGQNRRKTEFEFTSLLEEMY